MHKSTQDRHLTEVHWPIHRGRGGGTKGDQSTGTGGMHRVAGWGTEAVVHITARGLNRSIDRTICSSWRVQEAKGNGSLERNNINTTGK